MRQGICPDTILHLVETIYDEVWQENPWVRFLKQLRLLIPCHTMAIEVHDAAIRMATYYFAAGRRVDASDIGVWEERAADQTEDISLEDGQVQVYNDWRTEQASPGFIYLLKKYDVLRSMSMGIASIDGVQYSLHSGRSISAPAYSTEEQEIFRLIAGHLARAIRLRLRFSLAKTSQDLQADAMERLSVGALIVDHRGVIVFTNTTAERVLKERDGLTNRHGQLRATHSTANHALQEIIAELHACSSSTGQRTAVRALSIPRLPGVRDLYIVLKHHRIRDSISDRLQDAILVYIHDPEMKYGENTTVYQQLFRFTPTEAVIAAAMANGESIEAIEQDMAISHNTMRAHLRSMFTKTDVNSRADLIRLLVKSPAPLASQIC